LSTESTVSLILAFASLAVVFAVLLVIFAAELRPAGWLRSLVVEHAQKGSLAVAAVAMAGSLYYSEYVGFIPCEFCWYQRIAMYPLAVLLGIAVVTRTRLASRYVIGMAVIGLALSTYHYQLQVFPDQAEVCSGGVSCAGRYVEEFGFVSIPFMAGAGFIAVLLLEVAEWRSRVARRIWGEK
jgi:disulfide bond formation protein DsbB